MSKYAKGRRAEYEVKKKLQEEGYLVVRSASSKSPFDLVAIRDDFILLIQVKVNQKTTQKLIKELEKIPVPDCVLKEIWTKWDRKGFEVLQL